MGTEKFSDFPYYIMDDYFTKLATYYNGNIKKDENVEDSVLYDHVIFDEPWLDYKSGFGFLDFESKYNTKESNISGIRLRGPKTGINVSGSEYTVFHAKIKGYGYKPVKLRPLLTGWKDVNWLNFERTSYIWYLRGIFTEEELKKIRDEFYEDYPDKKLIIEYFDNKYLILNRISTNDDEINQFLETNSNEFIDQINIFESKPNKSHAFKKWQTKKTDEDETIKLDPENELYLRKDSYLFKWFRKELKYLGDKTTNYGTMMKTQEFVGQDDYFQWNHENFINDNLLFSFVGCTWPIWPDKDKWKIYHKTMKDFMIESLPENNMSDLMKIFLWEIYDRVYHEIYNMQKNIYTLLDPEDTYSSFIGYLSLFYGINLDKFSKIPEKNQRWYVKNLPYFLKKKGTYASLWITWNSIIEKSNKLFFYERWHNKRKKYLKSDFTLSTYEVLDEKNNKI